MVDYKSQLLYLGKSYQNMVLLVGDLQDGSLVSEFENFFPARVMHFGQGERNMLAAAAGFCLAGKLPVVLGEDLLEKGLQQVVSVLVAPRLNVRLLDFGGRVDGEQFGLKVAKDLESFVGSFEEYGVVCLRA